MLWYVKSRRAQTSNDCETWVEGGVIPTLNAFDIGDTRATVIVVRMREGKPGGGKGPLLSKDRSLTLGTGNDQTLFILYGNRVGDVRIQGDVINTLQARMGTGGNNMPMIAFSHTQGLDAQPSEDNFPTLRTGGAGMAVAYDEFNDSVADTHHTLRAGTKQSTGVIAQSTVRRLTPVECERLQGFPDNWTDGQADTHRYKQMGNAVTVNVARWIGERLNEA